MNKKEGIEKALKLAQRILDRYISTQDDDWYVSWYWSCLKDIAYILLWDDTEYWVK